MLILTRITYSKASGAFASIAFAGLVCLTLIYLTRPVSSQTSPPNGNGRRRNVTSGSPIPPRPAATLQTIYAPMIDLPEIATGRIVFNSRSGTVTEV
jgi:hypothetical protein